MPSRCSCSGCRGRRNKRITYSCTQKKKNARFVDIKSCIGCGACFEVCPVKVKNEYNEGLDERKAIFIPYPGALPKVAVIDKGHCLHLQGKECNACQDACPFGSVHYKETDQIKE